MIAPGSGIVPNLNTALPGTSYVASVSDKSVVTVSPSTVNVYVSPNL